MMTSERDKIIFSTLKSYGVDYVLGETTTQEPLLTKEELVKALILSDSPRLKLSVVAFFLTHPEDGALILKVLDQLEVSQKVFLKYYYTAAVYLQALWKSQLASEYNLTDYFSQELGLPNPDELHGRLGLFFLEQSLQKLMKQSYDYLSVFDALVKNISLKGKSL